MAKLEEIPSSRAPRATSDPGGGDDLVCAAVLWKGGEIRLEDGTVAAEAAGIYIRLPQEEIQRVEEELDFRKVVPD